MAQRSHQTDGGAGRRGGRRREAAFFLMSRREKKGPAKFQKSLCWNRVENFQLTHRRLWKSVAPFVTSRRGHDYPLRLAAAPPPTRSTHTYLVFIVSRCMWKEASNRGLTCLNLKPPACTTRFLRELCYFHLNWSCDPESHFWYCEHATKCFQIKLLQHTFTWIRLEKPTHDSVKTF